MLTFELVILDWIQANLRNPALDLLMPVVTLLGSGGLVWIALACILMFMPKHRKTGAAVLAGLALEVICCNLVLKPLVGRLRPCDVNTAGDAAMRHNCLLRIQTARPPIYLVGKSAYPFPNAISTLPLLPDTWSVFSPPSFSSGRLLSPFLISVWMEKSS